MDEIAALNADQQQHARCDIEQHPWLAVFGAGFAAGRSATLAEVERLRGSRDDVIPGTDIPVGCDLAHVMHRYDDTGAWRTIRYPDGREERISAEAEVARLRAAMAQALDNLGRRDELSAIDCLSGALAE